METNNEIDKIRNDISNMMDNCKHEVAVIPENKEPEVDNSKQQFDDDFNYSRDKLKTLVDMGEDAISNFKEIADETGEARAYSVLAELLKNTGDLVSKVMQNAETKDLINTRNREYKRKQAALDSGTADGNSTKSVNNNTTIFVGSTKDLLEKIQQQEKQMIIDAVAEEVNNN